MSGRSTRRGVVIVVLAALWAMLTFMVGVALAQHIIGDNGDNTLTGTPDHDLIEGFGGQDTINARAGTDTVEAGTGIDDTDGGDQGDEIHGGDGPDTLKADAGQDVIEGGDNGDDLLRGGDDSNDNVYGENGQDYLWTWDGNPADYAYGGPDYDTCELDGPTPPSDLPSGCDSKIYH
jgi:Ca2+-binding RTX toxin-like protein